MLVSSGFPFEPQLVQFPVHNMQTRVTVRISRMEGQKENTDRVLHANQPFLYMRSWREAEEFLIEAFQGGQYKLRQRLIIPLGVLSEDSQQRHLTIKHNHLWQDMFKILLDLTK